MPWTGKTFAARHNKSLSKVRAKMAARQANAILRRTGDEGMAIAVANKSAKKQRRFGEGWYGKKES